MLPGISRRLTAPLALVYMEAPDEAAIRKFTASDAPFNAWFREVMKEVHGVDISSRGHR